jgi:uncharacterized protein (TIGR02285 family)
MQLRSIHWAQQIVALVLGLCIGAAHAQSATRASAPAGSAAPQKDVINWYTYNLPPLYIGEGSLRGQGVLDITLRQHIAPALPGFGHEVRDVPVLRLEQALRNDAKACVIGLFRNASREAFMHFSTPLLGQLPPGVFVARNQLARLAAFRDAQGVLSLRGALASGDIRLGAAVGRSYGAGIDALLAEPALQAQVARVSATNPTLNLMAMLSLGRIELLVALPYEPNALRRLEGASVPDMVFVPVSESPQRINGFVACAKSPQGAAVIAKVDALLAQPAVIKAVRTLYDAWLDVDDRLLNEKTQNTIK